jgi:hypothetical protein
MDMNEGSRDGRRMTTASRSRNGDRSGLEGERRPRLPEREDAAPTGRKPYTSPKLTGHGAIAKGTAVTFDAAPSTLPQ